MVKKLKYIDKKPKTLFRSKSLRCPLSFCWLREEESKVIYSEADGKRDGIPGDFFRLQLLSFGHSMDHHKRKQYANNQI